MVGASPFLAMVNSAPLSPKFTLPAVVFHPSKADSPSLKSDSKVEVLMPGLGGHVSETKLAGVKTKKKSMDTKAYCGGDCSPNKSVQRKREAKPSGRLQQI